MGVLSTEQLLAEIEDVIRTMPPRATILQQSSENSAWFGRALSAIENWNLVKGTMASLYLSEIMRPIPQPANVGVQKLTILLHQARHDLLAQIPGAGNVAVTGGMVFDYFDGIRQIIQLAKKDLFFVDPYLDADFVSRYLPHAGAGVAIRLLAREKLATLLPAVDAFGQQAGTRVEVRSAKNFHDRYLLIDGDSCYQSGASFKDGAKSAPTTVTQIIDAFPAVAKTYEDIWSAGKIER
jgi:hypothetical protein